jgi:hypothetical protein
VMEETGVDGGGGDRCVEQRHREQQQEDHMRYFRVLG